MSNPTRYSQWQITLPFSLNNDYFGIPAETELFFTPNTEAVPVIVEFNPVGPDPSGWRHLIYHPSFSKILASGAGHASILFDSFDLNSTDISSGSGVSKTRVFLFRIAQITSPQQSRVYNIKLWASDLSDFLLKETNKVLYKTSTPWLSGFAFTASDIGNKSFWLSDTIPDEQNLFRTNTFKTIHGSGDMDVSEWAYVALGASGTTPLGEYGNIISGQPSGFLLRISYNIDNRLELWD